MRPGNVALLSLAGMLLASVTVYSAPWWGPQSPAALPDPGGPHAPAQASPDAPDAADASRFSAGSKLLLEGRVGHARVAQGADAETYVLLEVKSAKDAPAAPAPSNLALVIDRSGSMKGNRIRNAIRAAIGAVESLAEGDVVSVVAFDTRTTVVVPATVIDARARESVRAAIEAITLGGDTCISCGVEEGTRQLLRTTGKVSRMIVLSDGDANNGVRDVAGFQRLAEGTRDQGVAVTTIGVDLTYNQRILAVLAQASGGRHHFVEDDAALARVFQAEAETLRTTVASDAEASIELGEGVALEQVIDRSFRREGRRVVVPLGSFAPGDAKTVLLRVRVPAQVEGAAPVADVRLVYRDLAAREEARCSGALGVIVAKEASELDALVRTRLARGGTAATLLRANELFEQGKTDEARRVLDEHRKGLEAEAEAAARAAPGPRKDELEQDFKGQSAALSNASSSYGASADKAPAPEKARETTAGRRAVRAAQELANPYME